MAGTEQDTKEDWVSPNIRCKFGPYFKADPEDQLKIVGMVQNALGAGKPPGIKLLTDRQGLEQIAPIFGIENVGAAMDALNEERVAAEDKTAEKQDAQHQKEMELQHALGKSLKDGDSGSGTPAAGKKEPPQD